jgi:hypothetical protein
MSLLPRARDALKRVPMAESLVWAARRARARGARVANVAMFHTARCGSTVLGDLLDQHPHVRWGREVFERMDQRYPAGLGAREILQRSMYAEPTRYYGFETKYLDGQDLRPGWVGLSLEDYLALLGELGFERFVLLRRRNYLRQVVSIAVARASRSWHVRTERREAVRVRLDVDAFRVGAAHRPLLELFRHLDERHETLAGMLAPERRLLLSYEDDIQEDPRRAYERVRGFVGAGEAPVTVQLKRANPFALDSVVENADEVRRTLEGTPYAWMLDA